MERPLGGGIATRAMLISPDKGADQLVWLAESLPGTDWESGTYYVKRKPARRMYSTPASPATCGTAPNS